jgi:hypothetical protein
VKHYRATATTKIRARAVRLAEMLSTLELFERKTVVERAFALLGEKKRVVDEPSVRIVGWEISR